MPPRRTALTKAPTPPAWLAQVPPPPQRPATPTDPKQAARAARERRKATHRVLTMECTHAEYDQIKDAATLAKVPMGTLIKAILRAQGVLSTPNTK